MHILSEESKKVPVDTSLTDLVMKGFDYNLEVDYSFQHRYRTKSIESYFMKEMFCAFIICILSVVIWFDYLNSFKSNDVYMYSTLHNNGTITSHLNYSFVDDGVYDFTKLKVRQQYLSPEERKEAMETNFVEFTGKYYIWQLAITSVLLLSLVLRMVFNVFKDKDENGKLINNIAVDKYLSIDVFFAGYSILVFQYILM